MPTVGWIVETAEKAWEAAHPPRASTPGPALRSCPFCNYQTAVSRQLLDHLAATHVGTRPVLLIDGIEPGAEVQIFTALSAGMLDMANCTDVRVGVNGAPPEVLSPRDAIRRLSREREARVDIRLRNVFDRRISALEQHHVLDFLVPEDRDLAAIDRAFSRELADEKIDFLSVDRFLNTCPQKRSARRYAEALADYARGVLVKDRPAHVDVTVRYAQYRVLYQQALSVLRQFERTLPNLVCNAVRFALNDFAITRKPTGFVPLDAATRLLGALVAGNVAEKGSFELSAGAGRRALCPVDEGVARVAAIAERLSDARQWTPVLEQECRQAAEAETLDATDRHKVLALWAGTALRLDIASAAREPLIQLSTIYPFDRWATAERERSSF